MKQNEREMVNEGFVADTQPDGGISTKNDQYLKTGALYSTCVHVYDIPSQFSDFWLMKFTRIPDVTVVVDTVQRNNTNYQENITKAVDELTRQRNEAKSQTNYDAINEEIMPLRELSLALRKNGEIIKPLYLRIYCYGVTLDQLERKVNEVLTRVRNEGFKATVFLAENVDEYKSMFLPASEQDKLSSHREGIPLSGQIIGLGFAHNQTSLTDPFGSYFGYTQTSGLVYWDLFHVDKQRTYYNLFLTGDLGSGKSTTLKKVVLERALRGDLVRVFDRVGEFSGLARKFNGQIVQLDGSNGIINMFQIFATVFNEKTGDVDEAGSYKNHLKDLSTKYRLFDPQATARTAGRFSALCDEYYRAHGYLEHPTQFDAEEYPVLSDIIEYLRKIIGSEERAEYRREYETISMALESLQQQNGDLFDGYTTLPNLDDVQFVSYDLHALETLDEPIQNLQIYNAMNATYTVCIRQGREQMRLYNEHKITLEEVRHFLWVADECHTIINIQNADVAEWFVRIMSEDRKFFGSVALATQRMERMFPSGSNAQDKETVRAINAINQIYTLCQYKIVLRHDISTIGTPDAPSVIRRMFGTILTEGEFQRIPYFDKGEAELLIGAEKLHMHFHVTDYELELFGGGA
ncbi:VirB4 family type IV secretion system protein [Lacticaseibacillus sharpeae]|nr:ATP-binding protein [Lacticaseibacillus sharpeae]